MTLVGFPSKVAAQKYHCEKDTAEALSIIREFHNPGGKPSDLVGKIALRFVGREYVPITATDTVCEPEIRLDGFDDMAFVNTVSALARCATQPGLIRPVDVAEMIESLSFRRGEANGFPSRMIYSGDWILDNRARGNVRELTEDYSDRFRTKSLEYVSRHPAEYAALKDSATLERQKIVEMGYRTFKLPYMKRESGDWKATIEELRPGDIVFILGNQDGMDTYQAGILVKQDDGYHLVHASQPDGKVVVEGDTFGRYMKRLAKHVNGWRWVRLK